jgi:protein SCO1/2
MGCSEQKTASMYRIVLASISLFFLLMGCKQQASDQALPYYNTPDFSPIFLKGDGGVDNTITHTIGKFALSNQDGEAFSEQDVQGKIQVANFFFTGCGSICPGMMSKLKKLNSESAKDKDIVFLSFSVTPWRDSVARLREYANANKIIASNWHLLTGPKADIYSLARRSYFAEEALGFTKDSTDFLHTEHVLLVDKTGRIRGIYNGTLDLDMEQLSKDIKVLKAEDVD